MAVILAAMSQNLKRSKNFLTSLCIFIKGLCQSFILYFFQVKLLLLKSKGRFPKVKLWSTRNSYISTSQHPEVLEVACLTRLFYFFLRDYIHKGEKMEMEK